MRRTGFTLIELMIVVAIVSFLALVSVPSFKRYIARAKRTEAYMNLAAIYTAEKLYWAEHGSYSADLGTLGFKPEGYSGGGATEHFLYTYGFPGAEGTHFFTGKLCCASHFLHKAHATQNSFLVLAAADILGSGKPDVVGINEKHEMIVLQDGLSD